MSSFYPRAFNDKKAMVAKDIAYYSGRMLFILCRSKSKQYQLYSEIGNRRLIMCFSATASFTVSGLLTFAGILSIKKAQSSLRLLACVPLIFAIQQCCEGIIWLDPMGSFASLATIIFFTIATVLWPVWIPLSTRYAETDLYRKKMLYIPLCCGIIFSILALIFYIGYGVKGMPINNHIAYLTHSLPIPNIIAMILYGTAVILPNFISSLKQIWFFGLGIIGAYLVTHVWFPEHFASVWCFFAAVLSLLTVYIIYS